MAMNIFLIVVAVFPSLVVYVLTNINNHRSSGRSWYEAKPSRVNLAELVSCLVVGLLSVWLLNGLFKDSLKADQEHLNGRIASKESTPGVIHHHDCIATENDYDSKGNYEGSHCTAWNDWDEPIVTYTAETDFAKFFPQGNLNYGVQHPEVPPPAAWAALTIGEPVAVEHTYQNILKASGESVFAPAKTALNGPSFQAPPRPISLIQAPLYSPRFMYVAAITGTQALSGTQAIGNLTGISTNRQRNQDLMDVNADLGNTKQANLQIIETNYPTAMWADAVLYAWNRGSKNDLDIFIGVDPVTGDYKWVEVLYGLPGQNTTETTRTGNNALLAVTLRDRILDECKNDSQWATCLTLIKGEVLDKFNRTPNKEFAHLEPGIHPTNGQYFFICLISLLLNMGLTSLFTFSDLFGAD